ncbi:exopolysaccharide Pel transporter PelG [Sphingomonas sp. RP10(2022)]|uniref:Exopolysaccharide Pel transporter PelG n=1 Tax=Sphingomonas liriopis TaxID=2949094 RepID=A0A9X2KSL7_9SPHN|nr:exopolysaccharide Pel transporter PelG [Sphingomonas liriopis]MCP3733948.1 exopolysaccharide Pel transporter PelG [Sphingomonas liriopis]
MAGIGFQLAKTAREGGVGGIAGAAAFGALISAGPWLMTAIAMVCLQAWTARHLEGAGERVVQTVLVYAFSLSALAAAPIGILATRMAADRIFARDAAGVNGIMLAALAAGGVIALGLGAFVFGVLAALPPGQAAFATLTLAWLTQVWIAAPLLTALRRYRAVPLAYLLGIVAGGGVLALLPRPGVTLVLAVIAVSVGLTLAVIVRAIRRHFVAVPALPAPDAIAPRLAQIVAAAGVAAVAAIWIDKWLLWFGPDSVAAIGRLRLNPINDSGSFLGLLTMVPGLTLILIVGETRFDRAFGDLIARCTGTSTLERIEEARSGVTRTLLDALRLLVLVQALVAALAWVLAVPLLDLIGADTRAIFAFRQTSLGAVFHLIAIAATVVLAYYDLFGRILLTWALFAIGSGIATLAQWDAGFAAFGWGYMAGAVVGASVGLALVAEATVNLTYLLFVGNNPSVVGHGGRLL